MSKLRILILYPDSAGLALLTSMLKSLGHIIEEATTDRAAVRSMERNDIDLVLAGVDPLDAEALELLMYVRRKHREVPVILLFPRLHPERAKEALRLGAMAVLKYPVPAAELRAAVLQALERSETRHADLAGSPAGAAPAGATPKLAAAQLPTQDSSSVAPRQAQPGAPSSRSAAPSPVSTTVTPATVVPTHRVEQHAAGDRLDRQRPKLAPGDRSGRDDCVHTNFGPDQGRAWNGQISGCTVNSLARPGA